MIVDPSRSRYAIIDVSGLAYARWHTIPASFWKNDPGTLFGALHQSCSKIADDLCVGNLVFCFDGGYDYRREIWPEYKKPRQKAREIESPETKELRKILFEQMDAFREYHLPMVGCRNVFYAKGFEADDLIAACVKGLPNASKIYVVSNDEDLFQLIEGNRVVVYRPPTKTVVNETDFRATHHDMPPCLYASAKAWAGCGSDNIIGLSGIGMKRASQFIMGKGSESFRKTFYDSVEVFNKNIKLTKLPAPGTPECQVVEQVEPIRWNVMAEIFQTNRAPKGIRK
jgi:DNA polymerase-1